MQKAKRDRSDFFIDYADADAGWAEWVAWQLQDAGYTVVYRGGGDFRVGMNVVEKTNEAIARAERVIILLSPDYLKAFTAQKTFSGVPVWTAAFMQQDKLLPLRMRACRLKGLLQPLIPIELVGLAESEARKILLAGVSRDLPLSTTAALM